MFGTLYICGTPIGNLKDITIRCLETLKKVDLIAAEDTRHTLKLINHYEIKKPIESYHQHNKDTKGERLIEFLKQGKNIALVSDAGMPCISDPGEDLIKLCYENKIPVTTVPGPTAVISGIILSGFKMRSYCFEGFLPNNKKQRQEILEKIKNDTRSTILYEAPHNLKGTLEEIFKVIGQREIAIVREITKKYETVHRGSIEEILTFFNNNQPKGEIVLIIEGLKEPIVLKDSDKLENISLTELFEDYINQGYDDKTAIKLVAKDTKLSKRDVYKELKIK